MTNFRELIHDSHEVAWKHGFWDTATDSTSRSMMLAEKIALIHSEASEALESIRAGEPDYWIRDNGKPEGVVSELVDVIIRTADLLGWLVPPDEAETAYEAKMAYNKSRPYKHGKEF